MDINFERIILMTTLYEDIQAILQVTWSKFIKYLSDQKKFKR
jgi:hypothetical protein